MAKAVAALPFGDGRGVAPAGGPLSVSARSKLGSCALVSKDVVQLIGLVVEFADMLEFEPQHHRAVGLQ
jgi:hypothetical protein